MSEGASNTEATKPILALVVIRSTDLGRAERFYSALGLVLKREQHGGGPEHLVSQLGSTIFEIYPLEDHGVATVGVRLGFAVPSLDQTIDAATAVGGKLLTPPMDSPWGRRVVLSDPDGHRIELTELGDVRAADHDAEGENNLVDAPNNDAQIVTLDQIKVLNLIAQYQLANSADISGKRLRLAIEDFGFEEALMAPLVDTLVRPTERMPPNDRYKLNLWGWAYSEHAPKVGALIVGVLDIIRTKHRENPDVVHYSWSNLEERGMVGAESERYFVKEIIACAGLSHSEVGDGWRVPWDIEIIRKIRDANEFMQYRGRQEEDSRVQVQKMNRRIEMGVDPFDESADEVIEASGNLGASNDLEAMFELADEPSSSVNYHYYGNFDVGDKYTSTITGSNVGAVAVGDKAQAQSGHQGPLTQQHHGASIKDAQKALIDDEEHLYATVYEALGQFLRTAREIKVEGRSAAEVQAELMRALEEVWMAKGLEPQALPPGLKVVEMLAKNPTTAGVAKRLGA